MKYIQGKEYVLTYKEIIDLINQGYKALSDLVLLLKNRYIYESNTRQYRIYIDHNRKLFDVYVAVAGKLVIDKEMAERAELKRLKEKYGE